MERLNVKIPKDLLAKLTPDQLSRAERLGKRLAELERKTRTKVTLTKEALEWVRTGGPVDDYGPFFQVWE